MRSTHLLEDPRPSTEDCGARARAPVVLVAITHPVMRRWACEVLSIEEGACWQVARPAGGEMLVDAIGRTRPELVVVDSVDFPRCCRDALDALPPERVIVIGPEPESAYRRSALAQGAGGWVSRDHLGEELGAALRPALDCDRSSCHASGTIRTERTDPTRTSRTGGHLS